MKDNKIKNGNLNVLNIEGIDNLLLDAKVVCDLPKNVQIVGKLGFDKLVDKPFYRIIVVRCNQFMAF
uniref:Uncharacterized protein n=1 Tax=Strongyloides venezuelensis TaxID=75913 RepID=A0A0K0F6G3_STRVS